MAINIFQGSSSCCSEESFPNQFLHHLKENKANPLLGFSLAVDLTNPQGPKRWLRLLVWGPRDTREILLLPNQSRCTSLCYHNTIYELSCWQWWSRSPGSVCSSGATGSKCSIEFFTLPILVTTSICCLSVGSPEKKDEMKLGGPEVC